MIMTYGSARDYFLASETEFGLFLAVWKILSCPWAETAHMRHLNRHQLFTNVTYARNENLRLTFGIVCYATLIVIIVKEK